MRDRSRAGHRTRRRRARGARRAARRAHRRGRGGAPRARGASSATGTQTDDQAGGEDPVGAHEESDEPSEDRRPERERSARRQPRGSTGRGARRRGEQAHALGQQPVLERAQQVVEAVAVDRRRHVDRRLQQDRAGVDPLVDEVDGDAGDLHAVVERVARSRRAREGGQQRRVDVDDAIGEAREEAGAQQRHVARRARPARRPAPASQSAIASVARRAVRDTRRAGRRARHAGRRRAFQRRRLGLVGRHRDDRRPRAMDAVEQHLEVRARRPRRARRPSRAPQRPWPHGAASGTPRRSIAGARRRSAPSTRSSTSPRVRWSNVP